MWTCSIFLPLPPPPSQRKFFLHWYEVFGLNIPSLPLPSCWLPIHPLINAKTSSNLATDYKGIALVSIQCTLCWSMRTCYSRHWSVQPEWFPLRPKLFWPADTKVCSICSHHTGILNTIAKLIFNCIKEEEVIVRKVIKKLCLWQMHLLLQIEVQNQQVQKHTTMISYKSHFNNHTWNSTVNCFSHVHSLSTTLAPKGGESPSPHLALCFAGSNWFESSTQMLDLVPRLLKLLHLSCWY